MAMAFLCQVPVTTSLVPTYQVSLHQIPGEHFPSVYCTGKRTGCSSTAIRNTSCTLVHTKHHTIALELQQTAYVYMCTCMQDRPRTSVYVRVLRSCSNYNLLS